MTVNKKPATQSSKPVETTKVETPTVEVKQEEVIKEVVQEVVQEVKEPVNAPKKVKVELDRNLIVACRNVTSGNLTYVSRKTMAETNWEKYGDAEYLELSELVTMKGSQPKFLNNPWIVIDDEDVVEYLGLGKIYANIIADEDITDFFFKTPLEIEEALMKAPKGTKKLIAEKAREMVENEQLYDIRIMRTLDRVLNIDLTLVQA